MGAGIGNAGHAALEGSRCGRVSGQEPSCRIEGYGFPLFLECERLSLDRKQEPYEFARSQVKDMLLNVKQVEFMRQVKDDLYQRAVKRDKIKYYLE